MLGYDPKKGSSKMHIAKNSMLYSTLVNQYQLEGGHTLRHYKDIDSDQVFVLLDHKDKIAVEMQARKRGAAIQITSVWAAASNTFPVYKLYTYMVRKLNMILMSDSLQSEGGKAIWYKLSAEPGVTVFGWRNGKAVNLGDRLDHDTDADTHIDTSIMDNPDSGALNTVLVAVKKK